MHLTREQSDICRTTTTENLKQLIDASEGALKRHAMWTWNIRMSRAEQQDGITRIYYDGGW